MESMETNPSCDENAIPEGLKSKLPSQIQVCEKKRVALSSLDRNSTLPSKLNHKAFTKTAQCVQPPVPVPNLQSAKCSKPSFTVFVDETEVKEEPVCDLPKTVTHLFRDVPEPNLPFNLSLNEENESVADESPMVLDVSNIAAKQTFDTSLSPRYYIYDEDIYVHVRNIEKRCRPKLFYMRKQPDITSTMRAVLVDWLADVVESYGMETSTLYIAVAVIDRFLSYMSVLRSKLQLVGTAALFIAAKYEEIYPPELKEFVFVTDDTYTKKQVLKMEHLILRVLLFNLSVPTAYEFLQRYCFVCKTSEDVRCLAEYICELSLLEDEPYLSYLPSITAASAVCLAEYCFGLEDPWTPEYIEKTGYQLEELNECVKSLWKTYSSTSESPYQAIRDKYANEEYHFASVRSLPNLVLTSDSKCN